MVAARHMPLISLHYTPAYADTLFSAAIMITRLMIRRAHAIRDAAADSCCAEAFGAMPVFARSAPRQANA